MAAKLDTRRALIEDFMARKARGEIPVALAVPPKAPGWWAVCRVYDTGAVVQVRSGLSPEDADRIAGAMRDAATERELESMRDDGWNYLPRPQRRAA